MRTADTYRAARRNAARKLKLVWRSLPRAKQVRGNITCVVPEKDEKL